MSEAVLVQQLELNRTTWAAMQEHGVRDGTELSLDFFFVAPGEPEAEALASALHADTDYQVEAGSTKSGLFGKRSWHVTGTTRPTAASLAVLDEWLTRMVRLGLEHDCEFDGWGAPIPDA